MVRNVISAPFSRAVPEARWRFASSVIAVDSSSPWIEGRSVPASVEVYTENGPSTWTSAPLIAAASPAAIGSNHAPQPTAARDRRARADREPRDRRRRDLAHAPRRGIRHAAATPRRTRAARAVADTARRDRDGVDRARACSSVSVPRVSS
jgi:hypothetical protein